LQPGKIFIAPRSFEPAGTHPAPAAIYQRLDGDAFRIADARGRVLFVDFYASWCEPCKLELPLVEAWSRAHPDAAVVPVDVGEERSIAAAFGAAIPLTKRRARPERQRAAALCRGRISDDRRDRPQRFHPGKMGRS